MIGLVIFLLIWLLVGMTTAISLIGTKDTLFRVNNMQDFAIVTLFAPVLFVAAFLARFLK